MSEITERVNLLTCHETTWQRLSFELPTLTYRLSLTRNVNQSALSTIVQFESEWFHQQQECKPQQQQRQQWQRQWQHRDRPCTDWVSAVDHCQSKWLGPRPRLRCQCPEAKTTEITTVSTLRQTINILCIWLNLLLDFLLVNYCTYACIQVNSAWPSLSRQLT